MQWGSQVNVERKGSYVTMTWSVQRYGVYIPFIMHSRIKAIPESPDKTTWVLPSDNLIHLRRLLNQIDALENDGDVRGQIGIRRMFVVAENSLTEQKRDPNYALQHGFTETERKLCVALAGDDEPVDDLAEYDPLDFGPDVFTDDNHHLADVLFEYISARDGNTLLHGDVVTEWPRYGNYLTYVHDGTRLAPVIRMEVGRKMYGCVPLSVNLTRHSVLHWDFAILNPLVCFNLAAFHIERNEPHLIIGTTAHEMVKITGNTIPNGQLMVGVVYELGHFDRDFRRPRLYIPITTESVIVAE